MNAKEAGRIVTLLVAKFHRDALEAESQIQFAKDVALLHDYEIGIVAADELARAQDRFPTIREFRDAYHHVARRRAADRSETHGLAEPDGGGAIPEWVYVWWWASRDRAPAEKRPFPQSEPTAPDGLTAAEYQALLDEWRGAGAPKFGSFAASAASVLPGQQD